ncbi:DUF6296 family protein [Kitasatospora sp. NPDC127111]|uniref:DUF6296 family protein n=1 Tax=Kitasatospora sp. NPDC127111 TaxID=3345363 RepID=UPI00362F76C3
MATGGPPAWLVDCPEGLGPVRLTRNSPHGPHGHPVYRDAAGRLRAEVAACGLVFMIVVDGGQPYLLAHVDGLVVLTAPDGRHTGDLSVYAEAVNGDRRVRAWSPGSRAGAATGGRHRPRNGRSAGRGHR